MAPDSQAVLTIDAARLNAERAGIENFLLGLLGPLTRAWLELPGAERRVTVFSGPSTEALENLAGGSPATVVKGGGPGWTQARLPGALRAARSSVHFSPIPVLPIALRLPCPAVVTVHDLLEFRARWWYFRRLIGRTLQTSVRVICVSEATRQEVVREFPSAAAKCVVVHEAADANLYRPAVAKTELPATLSRLGVTVPPLLAVGTVQPRKNYARLIAAYRSLVGNIDDLPPLVIVGGPGWNFEPIHALPEQLGIADRVHFAGHVEREELADLMRHSRLLCAVSLAEGFGLPLVEAMFSGLPILAADIPPFREVAGAAARFVDPLDEGSIASGLRMLLSSPGEMLEMGRTGLGRRQLFSWDRAAGDIVSELERARLTAL